MYKDIAELIGLENYKVVNPYKEKVDCSFIIISYGYKDRVKKLNPNAEIFEIRAGTFRELIETLKLLKDLEIGDKKKIDETIKYIEEKEKSIKKLANNIKISVNPKGKLLKKVCKDLGLKIDSHGI